MTKRDNIWKLAENWKEMKHPARPSEKDKEVYGEYVSKIAQREEPKMLILGSTPCLRDLGHKHHVPVTVIDNNPDAFQALRMLKERGGQENYVEQDWEEMKIEGEFDLIIADTSLNMLKWEDYEGVLENIEEHLKSNGYYVERMPCRVQDTISEREFLNWLERLKEQFGKEIAPPANYALMLYASDSGQERISLSEHKQKIRPLYQQGKITEETFETLGNFWQQVPLQFVLPHRQQLFKLVRNYFEIERIISCDEPEDRSPLGVDLSPIVVCRSSKEEQEND